MKNGVFYPYYSVFSDDNVKILILHCKFQRDRMSGSRLKFDQKCLLGNQDKKPN